VPKNERIQQRKNLIDCRQDKGDDSKLPQILKVPVESSNLSESAVPRTRLDDSFRKPLLNRRFRAQDAAATCASCVLILRLQGFDNRPEQSRPQPMGYMAR
jgi:hypothetical protein